jgi:SDR family mycofactocin-dependent oxidoreductase
MGRVDNKVALVTGAARGMGRSHAVRLASEGADIVAVDALASFDWIHYPMPTEDDLAQTAKEVESFERCVLALKADVRSPSQMEHVVSEALERFGKIDVVVANAAIAPRSAPFWEITDEIWKDVLDVDLTGVFNTVRAAVPQMIKRGEGGSVILISSGCGFKGSPNVAAYTAAKHGVVGLGRAMANELGKYRVRANALCPGPTGTDMIFNDQFYQRLCPDIENPTRNDLAQRLTPCVIPEPYLDPIDVSNAVLWLASDESRYVTGTVLSVDLGSHNKT